MTKFELIKLIEKILICIFVMMNPVFLLLFEIGIVGLERCSIIMGYLYTVWFINLIILFGFELLFFPNDIVKCNKYKYYYFYLKGQNK